MISASLSINPSLSPPFLSSVPSSSSSSSLALPSISSRLHLSLPHSKRPKRFSCLEFPSRRYRSLEEKRGGAIAGKKMDIEEVKEEGVEEGPSLLENSEGNSKPRRIALFVEPSPFAYVSGYKNRFQNFIRYLREMGDEGNGKGSKEKAGKSLVDLGYQRAKSVKAIQKSREAGKTLRKVGKPSKRPSQRTQGRTEEMQELFQTDMSDRKQMRGSKRSISGGAKKKSKHSFKSKSRYKRKR